VRSAEQRFPPPLLCALVLRQSLAIALSPLQILAETAGFPTPIRLLATKSP
jgi:hypothetical protein